MVFTKKRSYGIFSLSIFIAWLFSICFVSAGSVTETTFGIVGCTFEEGGENVFVEEYGCSNVPYYGKFFCGAEKIKYKTDELGLGCSRGSTVLSSLVGPCCPATQICVQYGSFFKCESRITDCFANMSQAVCEDVDMQGVYYDNGDGIDNDCICSMSDQTCALYVNENDCNSDPYNVPKIKVRDSNVVCNDTNYVISEAECRWNGTVCQSRNNITQDYTFNGTRINCFNTFDLGECIDGRQNVTWESNWTLERGAIFDITPEMLSCTGCNGGEIERFCGQPLIRLPGFGLFSFIISFFIIGIYHFLTDRFKYMRGYKLS